MSDQAPKTEVTHLFQLEHIDETTKIHRFLDVMVNEQGHTYFGFTTFEPGQPKLQTVLPLSEAAMNMLYHALRTLQQQPDQYLVRHRSLQ